MIKRGDAHLPDSGMSLEIFFELLFDEDIKKFLFWLCH